MKHCAYCAHNFEVENFCTDCGIKLLKGRFSNDVDRELGYEEQCGECGRGFNFGEIFCGKCGLPRTKATRKKFRSYVPDRKPHFELRAGKSR